MTTNRLSLTLAFLLVACGGGSSGGGDTPGDGSTNRDAPPDMPGNGTFAITSPMIAEGAMFPRANTCDDPGNISPQLDFASPPANTMSYTIILTDKSTQTPLIHWAIYDIPATRTGLPADVEKVFAPTDVPGAHQTTSFQAATRGYLGPCPPNLHTYEFALYAVDAATLPGTTMASTRQDVETLAKQHMLGLAKLTGKYMH